MRPPDLGGGARGPALTAFLPAVVALAIASALALQQRAQAAPGTTDVPTASWAVSTDAIYTDMPFTLTLKVDGFEETPVPGVPDLVIAGCEVSFLGVSPSVASHIQITNGRRSEWKQVTFNYQWRVVATTTGRYVVPGLNVQQAGLEASTRAVAFEVAKLPETADMRVRMRLPDRPVWAGETFDVAIEWLVGSDVESHDFVVPLFNIDGAHVAPPGTARASQQSVRFNAGTGEVALPLERAQSREGGKDYLYYTFPAEVTLHRASVVDLSPVRVVARLQTGTTRDAWGFRRARYGVYRAEGKSRRITVKALPQAGRPASFVNAIGSGFSIDVQASRTVVAVGEPIELTLRVRGDGSLTGLSLPPLGGPQALPPSQFGVSEGSTAGAVDESANSKRFTATVRIKSVEAKEIPPIEFSYFDPNAGEYRSVQSQPIALSVDAGRLVGVDEVVAAPIRATAQPSAPHPDRPGVATLIGADMSLSAPATTLARPWGSAFGTVAATSLYGLSCLAFAGAWYRSRSGGRRAKSRARREASKALRQALRSDLPARQAAPALVAATRRLAQSFGIEQAAFAPLLERLETTAFDPAAAQHALDTELVEEIRALAEEWQQRRTRPATASAAALLAASTVALVATAAPTADLALLDDARDAYREALDETDRVLRKRLFAKAERALRPLAASHPQASALQADWGNAALGAQDVGRATLAFRRALRLAPNDDRARANLDWLRTRQPVWLPRPSTARALDSLLFWRARFTPMQLFLAGTLAFAFALLLLAPWTARQRRWQRRAAMPLLAIWVVASASAWLASRDDAAAVVVADGATLRSADSRGAVPAFANPLPGGTELTVAEFRDAWVRVALADGTTGWLPMSSIALVTPTDASDDERATT